jgi:predicted nucleic acid-binding protein
VRNVILDTDTLSETYKQKNSSVVERAKAYLRAFPLLPYTSVSVIEMLSGLYAKDARNQLARAEAFLARHDQIVPEPADYQLAAEIIGKLTRQGTPIGTEDPLIAACALNRRLPLATCNTRHYQYVIDAGFPLQLENWKDA